MYILAFALLLVLQTLIDRPNVANIRTYFDIGFINDIL